MCGGASGCRSHTARSRQSDCHRTAALGQPSYLTPTLGHFFSGAPFQACPSAGKVPIFISADGVKSIGRNEISRPGELPLIDMRVDYSDDESHDLWEDGERVFRRASRLDDNSEKRAVLLVLPAAE